MIISIKSEDLTVSVKVSENGEFLPFPEALLAGAMKAIKCITDEETMLSDSSGMDVPPVSL